MLSTATSITSGRNYFGKLPGLLTVLALLILGLFIYKDYGVAWDEVGQRNIGVANLQMIRSGDRSMLDGFADKDHGAVFELALMSIEEAINPATFREMIAIRHLCGFVFYLVGILCGYLLALRLFQKQWIALLGIAMLVLQPRIFAHSFFNSKDVPFLVAMLIALYAVSAAFDRKRLYLFVFAGIACGLAAGIRTMGLLLMLLVGIMLLGDIILARGAPRKMLLWQTLAFTFSAIAALYTCWPTLWYDPLQSLLDVLHRQSRYTAWKGGGLLFNGTIHPATDLPWYYIPEWFCISTPLGWLILGVAGIFLCCRRVFKRPFVSLDDLKTRMLLICAACFVVPVIAVIAMRSVVYDDWRHLYFIYPPFVMIALYAVDKLEARKWGKLAIGAICATQTITASAFMITAHPLQQVYFNPLVSHRPGYIRKHFVCDYWGLSYRLGLEYILAHDPRDTIKLVHYANTPLRENAFALPEPDRIRVHWTDNPREPGAYFLTTYRDHPEDHFWPRVWAKQVGGSTILEVYRIDSTGHY